jgi:predicted lipoprotein with Yx(FWY)xxD motif
VAILATACGTSSHPTVPDQVTVDARPVAGLGTALVNDQGYALYMFAPDKQSRVTCTGTCAGVWPPLLVSATGKIVAGPGVNAALLGRVPNPGGGYVVTYNRWPLYTYVSDTAPGEATGQALDLNGGLWYVIRPSGTPEIPAGGG